jgi:nucleoside-diphosphate-sugar epimerase
MRILLIGGTGNLSADCAQVLHAGGHEIDVVTRGSMRVPSAFRSLIADRKDMRGLQAALKGSAPEVVLNFLGFDLADVQIDYELFRGRIGQYVFISSATVYEKPHRGLPVTEEAPLGNAYWEYAQKKLACERWLMDRYRKDGFPVTVVRPSHTYSCRWVPNPISSSSYTFASRLERGRPVFVPDQGKGLWTLTATNDFAVGLAGLVGNPLALGEAFHITSDEALSWNEIVGEIACALGATSPHVIPIPTDFVCHVAPQMAGPWQGDKANPSVFDNSKVKRFVPGFECRKPFRVGVRQSVAWLRAHPDRQNLKVAIDRLCDEVVAAWRRESCETSYPSTAS